MLRAVRHVPQDAAGLSDAHARRDSRRAVVPWHADGRGRARFQVYARPTDVAGNQVDFIERKYTGSHFYTPPPDVI